MAKAFEFSKRARTPRLLAVLVVIYAGFLAAVLFLNAAWWLILGLALTTLPALWDIYRDTCSDLSLGDDHLDWRSGDRNNGLSLAQIDYARFDTRWDFSVRVTFVLLNGTKQRLPPQTQPPHRQFETELQARGIRTERHHFRTF